MKTISLVQNKVCWCSMDFKSSDDFAKYKESSKNNKSGDKYWRKFERLLQSLSWEEIKSDHIINWPTLFSRFSFPIKHEHTFYEICIS